ncbi:MAG: hypothetical protein EZS28_004055 [Streblomastix strix]|uniref:Uncharacterized protein n=1 Tax=Streblomastix strix TaxID=222440 RepID=A0A5J4WZG0_9EUKA|nr:MAG: hypothetical protein EZS28_004055 [Streblomastix strix]
MNFSANNYLQKLTQSQHSDYISSYTALNEVLRSASIHPQSLVFSRVWFFDQPITKLTSDRQRYTRAPLGARGSGICSIVQTCQANWQITIPAGGLALQINHADQTAIADTAVQQAVITQHKVNFTRNADYTFDYTLTMEARANFDTQQLYITSEHIKFLFGFSTACGPFQQFAICNDNTKLYDTPIYAIEQVLITANSLSNLCTNNSENVSPLDSIVAGKRHCGIFIDIPVAAFSANAAPSDFYHSLTFEN